MYNNFWKKIRRHYNQNVVYYYEIIRKKLKNGFGGRVYFGANFKSSSSFSLSFFLLKSSS